jgi:hypothetical protein
MRASDVPRANELVAQRANIVETIELVKSSQIYLSMQISRNVPGLKLKGCHVATDVPIATVPHINLLNILNSVLNDIDIELLHDLGVTLD